MVATNCKLGKREGTVESAIHQNTRERKVIDVIICAFEMWNFMCVCVHLCVLFIK